MSCIRVLIFLVLPQQLRVFLLTILSKARKNHASPNEAEAVDLSLDSAALRHVLLTHGQITARAGALKTALLLIPSSTGTTVKYSTSREHPVNPPFH